MEKQGSERNVFKGTSRSRKGDVPVSDVSLWVTVAGAPTLTLCPFLLRCSWHAGGGRAHLASGDNVGAILCLRSPRPALSYLPNSSEHLLGWTERCRLYPCWGPTLSGLGYAVSGWHWVSVTRVSPFGLTELLAFYQLIRNKAEVLRSLCPLFWVSWF